MELAWRLKFRPFGVVARKLAASSSIFQAGLLRRNRMNDGNDENSEETCDQEVALFAPETVDQSET
jgi:hypothetical protein